MKLTARNVISTPRPQGKSDAIVFDDDIPGFGLRLRGEARTLIFQYKLGDVHRRITLGAVSAVNFAEVRRKVETIYARVKLGEDPARDKADAKAKATETFEAIAKLYLAHQRATTRPSTYADVERHLLKHGKTLHRLQLDKITRREIATCVAVLTVKGQKVTANRVRATLSGFFGWAVSQGLIEINPVIGTARNKEDTRKRVLSPDELRTIWKALDDDDYGSIMKLLALSGQRADEIASLQWSELREIEITVVSEIDGLKKYAVKEVRIVPPAEVAGLSWSETKDDHARWPTLRGLAIVLPGERTKNHREHIVPLSEPARAILGVIGARPRRVTATGAPRDLVFGNGEGPFSGWSNSKEALNERIIKIGPQLPHWTPHDMRRSFSTHAAELGIEPHIVEAVLNHVSGHRGGVAGIYNRAQYITQKHAALSTWARHLLAWVDRRKSNVATLRRA
jgi:integrase